MIKERKLLETGLAGNPSPGNAQRTRGFPWPGTPGSATRFPGLRRLFASSIRPGMVRHYYKQVMPASSRGTIVQTEQVLAASERRHCPGGSRSWRCREWPLANLYGAAGRLPSRDRRVHRVRRRRL